MLACERSDTRQHIGCEKESDRKKSLPCAANPARHVRDIESKQTVGVGRVAHDAHAVAAASIDDTGAIDANVHKAVGRIDVASVNGCCFIDVVYITTGGIG